MRPPVFQGLTTRILPLSYLWLLLYILVAKTALAQETILSGLTWMTEFPATWNAAAPKVVSDGLCTYAVVCGFNGDPYVWSIARKRGIETSWQQGAPSYRTYQPPVAVIDRKGRLNIFFNSPQLRHFRYDHPSLDLANYTEIPFPFTDPVSYLHASYDAASDTILLSFNESSTYDLYFTVKYTDQNNWLAPVALPKASTDPIYLYATTLRSSGKYFLLAGEHPKGAANANYVAAVLFESASPLGPWQRRDLYRVYGNNAGTPYVNWVYPTDIQATPAGKVRVVYQLAESGSGHTGLKDGLYFAKEEDNYQPRFITSNVDDGFGLHITSSGKLMIFSLMQPSSTRPKSGKLIYVTSSDDGMTWSRAFPVVPGGTDGAGINPCLLDCRNGSMLGGKGVGVMYSSPSTAPFSSVQYATASLGTADTTQRFDYWYQSTDGTYDYIRSYIEPGTGRNYYYIYDFNSDGSYKVTYAYFTPGYYQVYIGRSNGSYEFYNSDGFRSAYEAPESYGYWYTGSDGARDYIYVYRDPSSGIYWWYIYDYDPQGNWVYTYVYNRPGYWYVEVRYSSGSSTRSDSTGFFESG